MAPFAAILVASFVVEVLAAAALGAFLHAGQRHLPPPNRESILLPIAILFSLFLAGDGLVYAAFWILISQR